MIASHSRNVSWEQNIARAEAQLAGRPFGMGDAIRESAAAMADPENALSYPSGPKISPFAHCIAGDLSRVATDRWAQRAVFGMDDAVCERLINRKGVRDMLIDAYCKVAADVGLAPAELQAVVWVADPGECAVKTPLAVADRVRYNRRARAWGGTSGGTVTGVWERTHYYDSHNQPEQRVSVAWDTGHTSPEWTRDLEKLTT